MAFQSSWDAAQGGDAAAAPPDPAPETISPSEPADPSAASGDPFATAAEISQPGVPAEAAPAAAPVEPEGVAATISVPPLDEDAADQGGEWELLLNRVTTWWTSGELGLQWQRIRGPLKGVAILLAVIVALRVYATVIATIDAIPLVSGLLELTGLIAMLHFTATRLLRTRDREEVLSQWRGRWLDFRGRD